MKTVKDLFLIFLSVSVLFFIGCGERLPDGMPPLTPCELTILQENVPLKGATVSLLPEEGLAKWNLVGITNDFGVVKILANGKYNGVPQGKYKVVVMKIESEKGTGPAIPMPGEPGYDEAVAALDKIPPAKRFTLVEKMYSNPTATPLTLDIPGRGPVKQNIEVGKAVRIVQ